jgi:AraC family transcriptional regulator, regulatory protein of adaptative response / methylated-DNA-[protein]-cysteine methyltransferase
MITDEAIKQHYYKALLQKSPKFEGLFFFALTSTGIFCRATCPARKPNYKYCVFFEEANGLCNITLGLVNVAPL